MAKELLTGEKPPRGGNWIRDHPRSDRGIVYLWNPREVQSRNSGGQPHTGTGGMSWWRCFQEADDDAGLGFGGQQSPHRSEVFWEGLFLVLNARPPMGADGHRFSPNSPSPLLPCLPGFFVSTLPPRLPPAPTAPGPIAGISTVLHLEKPRSRYYGYSTRRNEREKLPRKVFFILRQREIHIIFHLHVQSEVYIKVA